MGSSWKGTMQLKDGTRGYAKLTLTSESSIQVEWFNGEVKTYEGKMGNAGGVPSNPVVFGAKDSGDGSLVRFLWNSLDEVDGEWWPNAKTR